MWSALVFLSSLRLLFLNPTLSFRGGWPGYPPHSFFSCCLSGGNLASHPSLLACFLEGMTAPHSLTSLFLYGGFWLRPFLSFLSEGVLDLPFLLSAFPSGGGLALPLLPVLLSGGEGGAAATPSVHYFFLGGVLVAPILSFFLLWGGWPAPLVPVFLSAGGDLTAHPLFYYCFLSAFISG